MEIWNNLKNPPVVVALFQLKYNSSGIKLADFLKFDYQFKRIFPIRKNNIQIGIDLGSSSIPLGVSKITGTSDAKVESYVYCTVDQKVKFEISEGSMTYIDERPYQGWDKFKKSTIESLLIVSDILDKVEVIRTSIRFINRFTFDNFDNPQEYFKTLISSREDSQLPYPLRQYGFRLLMDIPNTDIYSVVNQNVENVRTNSYIYTFDIDVLDKQHLIFDQETLAENMELLRGIKNEIFFGNITQKTLDLCN